MKAAAEFLSTFLQKWLKSKKENFSFGYKQKQLSELSRQQKGVRVGHLSSCNKYLF